MRVRLAGCVAASALLLVSLAACGSKDSGGAVATNDTAGAGKAGGAAAGSKAAMDVGVTDTGFQFPATIPAGVVTLTLKNSGTRPHDLQLTTVDGGHTQQDVADTVASEQNEPIPGWLHGAGGTGTVPPGGSSSVTVKIDGAKKYFAFSTEGDQGQSDVKSGLIGELKVSGTSGVTSLPKADAVVTAREYTFVVPALKAGKQTIEFKNEGKELHHIVAAPIAAGKTIDDVKKALSAPESEQTGPPPIDFEKGFSVGVVDGGMSEVVSVDLSAGDFVFLCFMQDRAGGPPHAEKGMIAEQKVA